MASKTLVCKSMRSSGEIFVGMRLWYPSAPASVPPCVDNCRRPCWRWSNVSRQYAQCCPRVHSPPYHRGSVLLRVLFLPCTFNCFQSFWSSPSLPENPRSHTSFEHRRTLACRINFVTCSPIDTHMLFDGNAQFFYKMARGSDGSMLAAERAGLKAMYEAGAIRVPKPICGGTTAGGACSFLLWVSRAHNFGTSVVINIAHICGGEVMSWT